MPIADKAKRILIHLTASPYGGVETHVYHLSRLLVAEGADVTLASQRRLAFNEAWTHSLLDSGVRLVPPPASLTAATGMAGLLLSRVLLAARLPGAAYDRVIGQGHGGAFAWMKRFVRPNGLLLWHEYWYGVPTRGDSYTAYVVPPPEPFSWKMRHMVRQLDGIVTGCARAQRNLVEVQGVTAPIRFIPPLTRIEEPVTIEDRSYDEQSRLRVIMVGRMGYGKGVEALLSVWPDLHIGPAELHLHGPITREYAAKLRRYRLTGDNPVVIHDSFKREDLPRILAEADVGLMLSIEEGYGLAAWEYMACGLPFVITDVGAAPEFTADNPDAIMVPVLLEGIKRGIEELAGRIRAREVSRTRLQRFHRERFSFERSAAEHLRSILGPTDYWSDDPTVVEVRAQ